LNHPGGQLAVAFARSDDEKERAQRVLTGIEQARSRD
jgi:hypothetical protein